MSVSCWQQDHYELSSISYIDIWQIEKRWLQCFCLLQFKIEYVLYFAFFFLVSSRGVQSIIGLILIFIAIIVLVGHSISHLFVQRRYKNKISLLSKRYFHVFDTVNDDGLHLRCPQLKEKENDETHLRLDDIIIFEFGTIDICMYIHCRKMVKMIFTDYLLINIQCEWERIFLLYNSYFLFLFLFLFSSVIYRW